MIILLCSCQRAPSGDGVQVEQEKPWSGHAYTRLPSLEFGGTIAEIKSYEQKSGHINGQELPGTEDDLILRFNPYDEANGIPIRDYYFIGGKLTEAIQLISPYEAVLTLDSDHMITLNKTFEAWAMHEGFLEIRNRVRDYYLFDEKRELVMTIVPSQLSPDMGAPIYAEIHFFKTPDA